MRGYDKQKFTYIATLSGMAAGLLLMIVILVPLLMINNKNNSSNISDNWPWISNTKPNTSNNTQNNDLIYILLGSFSLLLSVISAILILSYKWDTKWCNENKKLWGLLSMFVIFFIGSIIFAAIGYKKYKQRFTYNKEINFDNDENKINKFEDKYDDENPFKKEYSSTKYYSSKNDVFDDDY